MKTVTLKNGATEAMPLVTTIMMVLEDLLSNDPMAFYDLVMICRDPNYQPFGNARERLEARGLLAPRAKQPHRSIKNIILSAVTGDDLGMALEDPIER